MSRANKTPISAASVGATAFAAFAGGTATGAPTTGTHAQGEYVIAQNGAMWICTAAGTPGTWVNAGSGGTAANVVTSTKATASRYSVGTAAEMAAATAGMTDGDIYTVTDVSTIATSEVMVDNELAAAVSRVAFTIPSTFVWTDVTAMTMEVPAGVPWDAIFDVQVAVTTNATSVTAPQTIEFRVLSVSTSLEYAKATYKAIFSVINQTQGWIIALDKMTPNDPLAVATVMKLQARATSNANITWATYTPDTNTPAAMMKAARR